MTVPQLARMRNTPAYAGKTTPVDKQMLILKKHPRVCGEDAVLLLQIVHSK